MTCQPDTVIDALDSFEPRSQELKPLEIVSASVRALEQGQEAGPHEPELEPSSVAGRGMRQQQMNQRLHVDFDGRDCQLVVAVAPAQAAQLDARPLAGGPRRLAPASVWKLRGFKAADRLAAVV